MGLPKTSGIQAAIDIEKEFRESRDWHKNVRCTWNNTILRLVAENDFDNNGQALLDEFGDRVSAYVSDCFDSKIEIESVDEI